MRKTMIFNKIMTWTIASMLVVSFHASVFAEGDDDKVGSAAFKFLNIQTDAHGAALGGLAAQANGANALFWNPAGIAGSEGMGFTAGMTQWLVETPVSYTHLTLPTICSV